MMVLLALTALVSLALTHSYTRIGSISKKVTNDGSFGSTSWKLSSSDSDSAESRRNMKMEKRRSYHATSALRAGEGADKMWDEAAERLISGRGGEVFVKEGGLSSMAAKAAALKAEEDIVEKEAKDIKINRAAVARQALSGINEGDRSDSVSQSRADEEFKSATFSEERKSQGPSVAGARDPSPLPLPFMEASTIGIVGKWQEQSGNFVLKPDADSTFNQGNKGGTLKPPLGVIHFLGGAFVGAAPHLSYRYILEGLVDAGYVVVATPYRLNFDYVEICDSILSRFDQVAVDLAAEYGAIPVIGVGHSCGALLQTLITSLFPDAPRAANVLISFNNRPTKDAIPGFDEFIVPLSNAVLGAESSEQVSSLRETVVNARSAFDRALESYAQSPLSPKFVGTELLPLLNQGLEVVDQVPGILQSVADGAREFTPSPSDTKEACRRMYRARNTLLIKFEDDSLDESVEAETTLREANTIMRMKRPMVEMDVALRVIEGTHLTPLSQTFLPGPPEGVQDLLKPLREGIRASPLLRQANEVQEAILTFLEDSISRAG